MTVVRCWPFSRQLWSSEALLLGWVLTMGCAAEWTRCHLTSAHTRTRTHTLTPCLNIKNNSSVVGNLIYPSAEFPHPQKQQNESWSLRPVEITDIKTWLIIEFYHVEYRIKTCAMPSVQCTYKRQISASTKMYQPLSSGTAVRWQNHLLILNKRWILIFRNEKWEKRVLLCDSDWLHSLTAKWDYTEFILLHNSWGKLVYPPPDSNCWEHSFSDPQLWNIPKTSSWHVSLVIFSCRHIRLHTVIKYHRGRIPIKWNDTHQYINVPARTLESRGSLSNKAL